MQCACVILSSVACSALQYVSTLCYDIFVNCNWVATRGQQYSTHFTCIQNMKFVTTEFKSGGLHSFISIQPYRPGWQEPEPSHVTGMALAHCILGKFLG